jgi:aspartyl-tRNA(Asn)/glutamyl-tRNA(Gln) amidotransferase subunit A
MRTLNDAARALADGTTTSRDLVEACLARIVDPAGEGARAFTKVYPEQARLAADAMDGLRRAGRTPSRLAGIPVSVKDLFDVAGEPTPAGSRILANALPAAAHATIVQRLLAAGLILIGRTNMTEFAFSGLGINPHHGTPRAPWDRDTGRIPGGSSSGAAVSVADGMALAGVGTDTGGSCRIPAAFCGVVGFKPTARRVPLDGTFPLAPSLDSIGPFANSVGCCAAMDAILAGEPALPLANLPLAGMRLCVPTHYFLDDMDASTERAMDRAVQRLDKAGASVTWRDFSSFDLVQQAQATGSFAVVEAYAVHHERLAAQGGAYDARVASRIMPGAAMGAADYIKLIESRARIKRIFAAEMQPYDALILPTVPIAPPALAEFATDDAYVRLNRLVLRNAAPMNFLDSCAISLPCHEPGAPPAGLMLVGTEMRDQWLLALAQAVEAALAWTPV